MKRLFDAFLREGYELFLIGGAVRDMAMGASIDALDDLDFATNARPQETLRIMRGCRLKTYEMGIEFGTVGAMLTGPKDKGFPKDVQVTTYRSGESYEEGSRHPTVRYGETLEQDLKRRDFAINSIAMDAEGRYVDPYDGLGDIKRGVLRVVGDPEETMVEDPLRILRVGRFMAKLGFQPTDALRLAAFHQAPRLLEISRQRWLQETHKLLAGPHVEPALEFLAETRLLGLLLPEVASLVDLHLRAPLAGTHPDLWARTRRRVAAAGADRVLSWAALLADIGRPWTRTLDPDCATPGDAAAWMGLRAAQAPGEQAAHPATFDHHNRMSALLFKGIARRFHFDNDTADPVLFLLEHQGQAALCDDAWTDADIRRFVRDAHGHHDALIALDLADAVARDDATTQARLQRLQARLRALADAGALVPRLPSGLGGHLIRGLDIAPGPKLGALIGWLNEAILAGDIDSDLPPQAYIDHLHAAQPAVLLEAQQATRPSRGSKPRELK